MYKTLLLLLLASVYTSALVFNTSAIVSQYNSLENFDVADHQWSGDDYDFPCARTRRYRTKLSDPTTDVDVNPLFTVVPETFEASAQQYGIRAQIAMSIGPCWVVDGSHGVGVDTDSLFLLASAGKLILDIGLVKAIDDGKLSPNWKLRRALRDVVPGFGVDGAQDITVGDFMQFKAPLGVPGIRVPLAHAQWDKSDGSLMKEGIKKMRPTFLPRPSTPSNNWYSEPTVGGDMTTHQYNYVMMGPIGQELIKASYPNYASYADYFDSLRGLMQRTITRNGNGLNDRAASRYQLHFKFPKERTDLWSRFIAPRKYTISPTRNETDAELLYNQRLGNPFSVEFKNLIIDYPYAGLFEPAYIPAGIFPDQPDTIDIRVPLLADPEQGNINNAAFAGRANAITMNTFGMTMACKGKVASLPRFLSEDIVEQAGTRVWNGIDLTTYQEGVISRAWFGPNKPTPGAISSCLPEDTVIMVGKTESFTVYSPSLQWSLTVTTADYPDMRQGANKKMADFGLNIVDVACRRVRQVLGVPQA